jgi:hypothetical protein
MTWRRQVIKSALDNLSPKELVKAVTVAVESATDDGEEHGPILIADLVDSYEVEAQGFLEKEEGNIRALVEKLRAAVDTARPDSTLAPMVSQLIQVVKNWDTVAQPIQVSTKSRGLDHNASHRIAGLVRGLAIHMFNEHGKLDFSQQLTNMLQEVFAEVGEVAERTAEDADALDGIAEQRARLIEDAKKSAEDWRNEITYETNIGAIFKDKLRISPDGIEWKGKIWSLESITRIRWGGIDRYSSRSNFPTKMIKQIKFGDNEKLETVKIEYNIGKLEKGVFFDNFIKCLWKAVGVRLLTDYLHGFKEGKRYLFGSTIVRDEGVEMEKSSFFSSGERTFFSWNDVKIFNKNGKMILCYVNNEKICTSFSYLNDDNVHVLEAAIKIVKERKLNRLSALLEV